MPRSTKSSPDQLFNQPPNQTYQHIASTGIDLTKKKIQKQINQNQKNKNKNISTESPGLNSNNSMHTHTHKKKTLETD